MPRRLDLSGLVWLTLSPISLLLEGTLPVAKIGCLVAAALSQKAEYVFKGRTRGKTVSEKSTGSKDILEMEMMVM